MTQVGFQIPNFNYPGVSDAGLFDHIALMAQTAERSGFDTIFVMDHFYQLPMLGPPENHMLEAYAVLCGLAARTESARLSTLVTGVTYRNPAHLAKIVTTLDLISGGRAMLGIGAAWFEPEHQGYGYDFPPLGARLDRLEEALEIIVPMLRGERPTYGGRYYSAQEPLNNPPALQSGGPPLLIGGNGEKRTLKLVARHANESNLTCPPADIPRKLEALAGHCAELGRDRSEIKVSRLGSLVIAPTTAAAERARNEFFAAQGMNWDTLPDDVKSNLSATVLTGDPDTVGEFVQKELIGAGLDGVVFNLPANGHDPEIITLAGETLRKAVGRAS